MLIRVGQLEDAENLSALAIQVWLHTYATEGISSTISGYVLSAFNPGRFSVLLSDPSLVLLVAEEAQGNLVGYALVTLAAPCPVPTHAKAELSTLYVQEPFIGKGIGALLLKQAELKAAEQDCSSVWLMANSKNHRAISFYEKHGYSRIGVTFFLLGDEKHENLVLVGRAV